MKIYASDRYIKKKWKIRFQIAPLFLIGITLSLHNNFGFDLTGGLLGERHPSGRGALMVIASPIILVYYTKGIREYFFRNPVFMEINSYQITVQRGWLDVDVVRRRKLVSMEFTNAEDQRCLKIECMLNREHVFKLQHIDITEDKLSGLLRSFDWPIT